MIPRLTTHIFLGLLVCIIAQISAAQEAPKAILVDEYGNLGCEELMARLDVFYAEAAKNPSAVGYAVIHGVDNDVRRNVIHSSMINGYSRYRGIGTERIQTVQGPLQAEFKVQLWLVPLGAERPFTEIQWSNEIPPTVKPFIFHEEFPFDIVCPPTSGRKVFADILLANPNSRANVVIRAKTNRARLDLKKEILSQIMEFKVPRDRVRIYLVAGDPYRPSPVPNPEVEFWFLP